MDSLKNTDDAFELYDFIADANFDQFVDLIRGETDIVPSFGYADDLINSCFAGSDHIFPGSIPETIDINNNNDAVLLPPNPSIVFSGLHEALPGFDGEIVMASEDNEDEHDDEDSSEANNTKRSKVDRSRTLISERRRRGRMKEKLYALRSLVPKITKMDKASIVGDAVVYVEDLQAQAKKLKAEIESLQASLDEAERFELGFTDDHQTANKTNASSKPTSLPLPKTIVQMEMFQVEERGFYVKVVCNNGEGTAVSLYKALESLTSFNVQTSNLASTDSHQYVLTFTLNVKECDEQELQINLPNLKLWVTGAFLNQGFQLN